jgi:hypothetical protein
MTATQTRKATKPKQRANIVEAMETTFAEWFKRQDDGTDTWAGWKAVLRAMDCLPMTDSEVDFFKSIAGGRELPNQPVSELTAACARRTGKDSIAALIGAYKAATFDRQDRLRPG